MGNYTDDQQFWGRPEDITTNRPFYATSVNVAGSNSSVDLGGSVAAALLAAYVAVPSAPNAPLYLSKGAPLPTVDVSGGNMEKYVSGPQLLRHDTQAWSSIEPQLHQLAQPTSNTHMPWPTFRSAELGQHSRLPVCVEVMPGLCTQPPHTTILRSGQQRGLSKPQGISALWQTHRLSSRVFSRTKQRLDCCEFPPHGPLQTVQSIWAWVGWLVTAA